LLAESKKQSTPGMDLLWGGVIGAHGLAFTIAALAELSTIKSNRADVALLGTRLAHNPAEEAPRGVDLTPRPAAYEPATLAGLSIAY
jgi:hypothetical protein